MNLLLGAALTAAWLAGLVVWAARQLGRQRRDTQTAATAAS
jgi:hypothetical protein